MRRVDAVRWVWITISHIILDWFVLIICVANLCCLAGSWTQKAS